MRLSFVKVEASGNDFVLVDARRAPLADPAAAARDLCRRRRSVGADGLVVVEATGGSSTALRVVHLEPDGARTFCLNALRGVVAWAAERGVGGFEASALLHTDAGELLARRDPTSGRIAVRLAAPRRLEARSVTLPCGVTLEGTFVDVGNPQLVVPRDEAGLEHPDLMAWGREARWLEREFPGGTNVSFVSPVAGSDDLRVRTYERGVEDETLACGTGILAAAFALRGARARDVGECPVRVHTRGGEVQRVTVLARGRAIVGAWSEGPARVVATGEVELEGTSRLACAA